MIEGHIEGKKTKIERKQEENLLKLISDKHVNQKFFF